MPNERGNQPVTRDELARSMRTVERGLKAVRRRVQRLELAVQGIQFDLAAMNRRLTACEGQIAWNSEKTGGQSG